MNCNWQAYLNLLPQWIRRDVNEHGRDTLQELRLRTGLPPELVCANGRKYLQRTVGIEDIQYIINCASQYSPWSASTIADGFLTATGGHRIGICGHAVAEHGTMRGIREPSSLCIRVARDFQGIAKDPTLLNDSILIIGPPGSGKTTLLRDLIRQRSEHCAGSISVVDERGELFPATKGISCFFSGRHTDILRFCQKPQGITAVLKTMGPACIAVDEITEEADCNALKQAGWCGVTLLATAHAAHPSDLMQREIYRSIVDSRLFQKLLVMQPDKGWRLERMPT